MQATESTTDSPVAENTALTCNVPGVVFSPLGIQTDRTDLTPDEFNCIFAAS